MRWILVRKRCDEEAGEEDEKDEEEDEEEEVERGI